MQARLREELGDVLFVVANLALKERVSGEKMSKADRLRIMPASSLMPAALPERIAA